jgi:threonine/homoserine/homoserine lactone efflux protein
MRQTGRVRSLPEFALIAVLVTVTPGPGTATILRVAARHGRRAAMSAILGNSGGVLLWGLLSAAGVSSLIVASEIAYDVLRVGGAIVLVALGLRSLLGRAAVGDDATAVGPGRRAGWRAGLLTSLSNPKLAVFFVALFPQFLNRDASVLPLALAMAATIVALDIVWYSGLAYAVDRVRTLLRPRVQHGLERATGGIMVAVGIRLATESR